MCSPARSSPDSRALQRVAKCMADEGTEHPCELTAALERRPIRRWLQPLPQALLRTLPSGRRL